MNTGTLDPTLNMPLIKTDLVMSDYNYHKENKDTCWLDTGLLLCQETGGVAVGAGNNKKVSVGESNDKESNVQKLSSVRKKNSNIEDTKIEKTATT